MEQEVGALVSLFSIVLSLLSNLFMSKSISITKGELI
jgi:hypothetical protein